MKIGILTQPLHKNYGGLLQAWALQTVLKRMGHEAWILQREYRQPDSLHRAVRWGKNLLKRCRGERVISHQKAKSIQQAKTDRFVEANINPRTPSLTSTKALRNYFKEQAFEACVVGSDQVWRKAYSPCLPNYFLDFLENEDEVRKVAYAASFGLDDPDFNNKDISKAQQLIKRFHAISVRERSGVSICRNLLHAEAVHVLDPTLLLEKDDYRHVAGITPPVTDTEKEIFCYFLDINEEKEHLRKHTSAALQLKTASGMPPKAGTAENLLDDPAACTFPAVEEWLGHFSKAAFVLTDSFHGCVFSIIFNKPFIAFSNKGRGNARFNSLLETFGLQARLIDTYDNDMVNDLLRTPIDWNAVNATRRAWQKRSVEFLENALS